MRGKTIYMLFVFLCLQRVGSYAQNADSIINRNIRALGGEKKLSTIKNVFMEGAQNDGGEETKVKMWVLYNQAFRLEYDRDGMANYLIITKDSTWEFYPENGQKEPTADGTDPGEEAEIDMNLIPLFNYRESGLKKKLVGQEEIDEAEAYKLVLTIDESSSEIYYIDTATYYVLRIVYKDVDNGKEEETVINFGDYEKTPDGYIFPMNWGSEDNQLIKFTTIKVNTEISMSVFKPARQ